MKKSKVIKPERPQVIRYAEGENYSSCTSEYCSCTGTRDNFKYLSVDSEIKYLSKLDREIEWADISFILKSFVEKAEKEAKRNISTLTYIDYKSGKVITNKQTLVEIDKTNYIITLWVLLDTQFKITEKIGNLIDFKKLFGVLGLPLNLIKNRAIKAIIQYIIIPVVIGLFTKK